ncbi:MAG: HEAT repeat domain-containing protein [Candidatus Marinimicrobia bacterium]|nr:HEAT repeat domain-containing protein [Candidatus Neomarinimicrobiota bacterium]
MATNLPAAIEKIAGHDLGTIMSGLSEIRGQIRDLDQDDLLAVADAIGSLFFIDHYERPDLQPAMDEGIAVLAEAGAVIVPYIIATFENSDMKANLSYAKVLGMIGVPAIPHLIEIYRTKDDPYQQSYALYALGKVKDRAILAVLNDVVAAVSSKHLEVRDSAIRALGKTMELISPKDLSTEQRTTIYQVLFNCVSDPHSAIRGKTIRTLSKMDRSGLLDEEQKQQLRNICERVSGINDQNRWDRAFIVRKEAKEALEKMD